MTSVGPFVVSAGEASGFEIAVPISIALSGLKFAKIILSLFSTIPLILRVANSLMLNFLTAPLMVEVPMKGTPLIIQPTLHRSSLT